jgi:site-specific DNA-cytosine methylase
MRFLYSKTIQQLQKPNGKKVTAFKVLKGKDGMISQVKGVTSKENNSIYDINMNIIKKMDYGVIQKKHRSFKIKSSDILTLLKESRSKNLKESSNKQIKDGDKSEKKVVKKVVDKPEKKVTKKVVDKPEKKVTKKVVKKVVDKPEKKVIKKVVKKEEK